MTSILTNLGAIAALQTLRSVAADLTVSQQQAASGLRVSVAADDAAYWSISTTMRSDNMAISAVSDALGLGAAKLDTAYAGTSAIVDVLGEFKAKLVAAKEQGVDRAKVQEELSQLNAQAESIVESASFSGENLLKTKSTLPLLEEGPMTTSVVSSFVRDASSNVQVKTMDIDLKHSSMLNEGGGGGILQKQIHSVGDIGGFRGTGVNSVAHQGHERHKFTGGVTFGAGDTITFDINVDGGTHTTGSDYTLTIDKALVDAALGTTDGNVTSTAQLRAVLQRAFTDNGVPATAYEALFSGTGSTTHFEIGSLETSGHPGSSITISNVGSSFAGGFAMGLEDAPDQNHDNMYPEASISFTTGFTVSPLAEVYFDVQVGPGAVTTYTINRGVVDAALGTVDGYIGSAADLATVISQASIGSNLMAVASGDTITFSADQTVYPEAGNRAARVYVGNVQSNPPYAPDFDLAEVDITQNVRTIDQYLRGVDHMEKMAISSASRLGALQTRIEMQAEFAERLSNSIDSGVGRLVDADMNEVSTRLKALQTQQQIAVQSLSIANNNSETLMQLFR
ncbi:flagellin [Rhizobium sp. TH135]|uniref:flagellin N-terminal helical domain-containing protein n=1 Tax=Rhizobium sp. TH135 TaxID=2067451 RepID=UPI000C7BC68D|nr:flagellin [Rhizobium sp. TH135]PLK69709.1 flagellin [Rhizobium sp. TH135]